MAKSKTHRNRRSRAEVQPRVGDLLRLPAGPVDLKAIATDATQGFMGAGKTGRQNGDASPRAVFGGTARAAIRGGAYR